MPIMHKMFLTDGTAFVSMYLNNIEAWKINYKVIHTTSVSENI